MPRFPPCFCNYNFSPPSSNLCALLLVVSRGSRLTKGLLLGDQERLRSDREERVCSGPNLQILAWRTLGLITLSLHQSLGHWPLFTGGGSHLSSLSMLLLGISA